MPHVAVRGLVAAAGRIGVGLALTAAGVHGVVGAVQAVARSRLIVTDALGGLLAAGLGCWLLIGRPGPSAPLASGMFLCAAGAWVLATSTDGTCECFGRIPAWMGVPTTAIHGLLAFAIAVSELLRQESASRNPVAAP